MVDAVLVFKINDEPPTRIRIASIKPDPADNRTAA